MFEIGELIGRGKEAEVRAFGADVVKLYPMGKGQEAVFREALALSEAARLGLPVPELRGTGVYDGRHALVMERIDGPTMGSLMLDNAEVLPAMMGELVDLQARLLACSGEGLPGLKAKIARALERVFEDPAERADWLARLDAMPDGQALCHSDFHPFNLVCREGAWVVLDWPDASVGPPAADLARTHLLLHLHDPALGQLYLDAVAQRGLATKAELEAWLPVLAIARLAEEVKEERPLLLSLAGIRSAP